MEYHGLTNRLPKLLFISAPPRKEWVEFAARKMGRDCQGFVTDYLKGQLPKLANIQFDRIHKTRITRYASVHRGAFKHQELL